MSQALQALCTLALIGLVAPPLLARAVPGTAVGRFCARLRDGIFELLA